MEAQGIQEIRHHVKIYQAVFAGLAVLTVVTVLASYLKVSTAVAITLALIIASIKASLVAFFFMHLISEKLAIYSILVLTVFFLLVMLLIPLMTETGMVVSQLVS